MSSRPWCQVVFINRWRKDVLSPQRQESRGKMSGVKSVASRCRVHKHNH